MTDFDARGVILQTLLLDALESARMAICVYDEEGRYVTVNECACTILGCSREELLGHDVGDFTPGRLDRRVLLSTDVRDGVTVITRKDGTTVPVAFVVTPTRVASLPYFVAVWWMLGPDDPRVDAAS